MLWRPITLTILPFIYHHHSSLIEFLTDSFWLFEPRISDSRPGPCRAFVLPGDSTSLQGRVPFDAGKEVQFGILRKRIRVAQSLARVRHGQRQIQKSEEDDPTAIEKVCPVRWSSLHVQISRTPSHSLPIRSRKVSVRFRGKYNTKHLPVLQLIIFMTIFLCYRRVGPFQLNSLSVRMLASPTRLVKQAVRFVFRSLVDWILRI